MKLSERVKLQTEQRNKNTRIAYTGTEAYSEAIKNIKSEKFPNLEWVNRVGQWQFFAAPQKYLVAECMYSRYGCIDEVFDEWCKLAEGKVKEFYVQQVYNPEVNYVINKIDKAPILRTPAEMRFFYPCDLQPCHTKDAKDNLEVVKTFIASKNYQFVSVADDEYLIVKK